MLDRFTSMEVFRALVRLGTFAAAAEELGLSRAMASKHIQALEQRLNARLFNRTTRSTRLTEAGQRYYEGIEQVFTTLERVEAQLLDDAAEVGGTLMLAAPPAFGAAHLAPVIADFMAMNPSIQVRLTLTDRVLDLVEEGIDVAVTVRELEDTNYIARHLADVAMIVCASPVYLERRGVPMRPTDLTMHDCLIFSEAGVAMRSDWQFQRNGRDENISVSGRFAANIGDALRQLTLAGHGIARLPDYLVKADLAAGRLIALLEPFAPALRPVHALYPHREYVPGKVRSFLDFASDAFRAPGK